MASQIKNADFLKAQAPQLFEAIHDRMDEIGPASEISTAEAFVTVYRVGSDMRKGYTLGKQETLDQMLKRCRLLQQSDDPAQVSHGLLIEAFITGWIGSE